MYIITDKTSGIIVGIGEKMSSNEFQFVLTNERTAYPKNIVNVFELSTIPTEVKEGAYYYTETDGFFLNPNYEEPNAYGIPNDVYNSILDDYTNELIESGVL